jgi:hypothetical protein
MAKRNPANLCITRIETKPSEGKRPVKGYEVRIYRREVRFNKFISDSAHGGKTKALNAARELRDKMIAKIKPLSRREKALKPSGRTTSGHRGVRLRTTVIAKNKKMYVYEHVEASWSPEPGKVIKRIFSVERLGIKEAWRLALECRRKGVAKIKG